MTREEKIRAARRLRALGWTAPAIGRELDVSDSTVRNWYLGGDCEECGAPITRCSRKYAATLCDSCSHRVTAQHGTRSMYNRGCGCDACRAAIRDYMRSLKGTPPPSHGASGYSNYGCRCQVCRDGHLVYMRSKGYEHQKKYAAKLRGTEPTRHGTEFAYNKHGCRCEACSSAASIARRQRRELRAA